MELWDAYDCNGCRTGETLVRGQVIPDGRYHLVAEVVVQHTDGTVLLMQRALSKNMYPGLWHATAGGSALAGEDAATAARRELLEETGLCADTLTPLYHRREDSNQTFYAGFLTIHTGDKNAVTLQEGETAAFRWMPAAEFLDFVKSESYIPYHLHRLESWIKNL